MLRFTIRDVLWLMVVAGLCAALLVKHRDIQQLEEQTNQIKRESKTWESRANSLRYDLMEGTNKNTEVEFIPNGIRYKPKTKPAAK
jgi:hypothetical protein